MYSFSALFSIKEKISYVFSSVKCNFMHVGNSVIDNLILNKHKTGFDTVSNQGVFNQSLP